MTSAEFKCVREGLGLTSQWLADRWGVALFSVQRWEKERVLPGDLEADLCSLVARFESAVLDGVASAGDRYVEVPRTDDQSPDEMPAAYHRAVALAVARRTGARIAYIGDPAF